MSEEALELIREAKEERLTQLDLSGCKLNKLPDELFELVWLEELILNNLKNSDIINDISLLTALTKLSSLQLVGNRISDITPIATLTRLKTLHLAINKISNITPLSSLINLNKLNLGGNRIRDLTPITALVNLNELHFYSNQISDITPLTALTNLNSCDLSNNKIRDIAPLAATMDRGINISLKDDYHYYRKIVLAENPIQNPPISIAEEGSEAILAYLKEIGQYGTEQLNEAKLIIVGEPGAGKTTLMETLFAPGFKLSNKTESTLGIEVRENWQFDHPGKPDTTFTTNIWDFGGQQIQYMTHQFFLTSDAGYVLVSANDRKEPTNFPYWFKIIHLLGEEAGRYSPVLVVLNEKDEAFINKFNFDHKFYEERYPELQISVCEVDLSKQDSAYDAMRAKIKTMLTNLSHVTDERPARWKDIRATLRERAKTADHISFNEYSEICTQHEVTDEQSQLLFSHYLHKLGSLLHFADDPTLRNFIILNPQWAVDAVYSVLNDNQVTKSAGYFSREQVEIIWQDKYNFDERGKLLNLMQKENFEICYPLDHERKWFIAPQLLNATQPEFSWNGEDNLRFRFQYKFMPEGIITRLIVRLNNILDKGDDNEQLIWRKGAVFVDKGCRALVQEEENRDGLKILDIHINGTSDERKYLLRRIRTEVHDLHAKWFRNIQAEEMIPCNCECCVNPKSKTPNFFEYSVLNRAYTRGKQTIECNREFIDVPVEGLLNGVFDKQDWNRHKEKQREAFDGVRHHLPDRQKVDVNVNITTPEAPAVKSAVVTQLTNIPKEASTPETTQAWYQQHWLTSLLSAAIVGLLAVYLSGSLKITLIAAAITGFVVHFFLNSKRRYFRIGCTLIALYALMITSHWFNAVIKTSAYAENGVVDVVIKLGDAMNPWLLGVLGVAMLGIAAFLFSLDNKQK